jgi:hypothetical protein
MFATLQNGRHVLNIEDFNFVLKKKTIGSRWMELWG